MKQAAFFLFLAVLLAVPCLAGRTLAAENELFGTPQPSKNAFDRWHLGFRLGLGQVTDAEALDRDLDFFGGVFLTSPFIVKNLNNEFALPTRLEFSTDVLLAEGHESGSYMGVPFRADRDGYVVTFKADALIMPFYQDTASVEVAQPYLVGGIGWMHPHLNVDAKRNVNEAAIEGDLQGDDDAFVIETGVGVQFSLGSRSIMDLRATYDWWLDDDLGNGMYALSLGLAF